jgi:hypothetical protein
LICLACDQLSSFASYHSIVFLLQDEAGEVLNQFEVFNSVEVLAPGIELDDLDSLLNSGESSFLFELFRHDHILKIFNSANIMS